MTRIEDVKRCVPPPLRPPARTVYRASANLRRGLVEFLLGDRRLLERQYLAHFGCRPDLDDPKTINEKVNWRKLYDRNPLHQLACDKVAVRDYVSSRIGAEYLVPILGVFRNPEEIPWADFSAPYVIKASHGSGLVKFVTSDERIDSLELTDMLHEWLRTNHYCHRREWAYKHIPRRIIIEEFIGRDSKAPDDYKIYCFDAVPRVIQVNHGRFTDFGITFYDASWSPLPFECKHPPRGPITPAPSTLPKMLELAGDLSREFDFVRVDLYSVDGRIYFGELTPYPSAGFNRLRPPEWERWLGDFWVLPQRPSRNSSYRGLRFES